MRALTFKGKVLVKEEYPRPERGPDEALIKVKKAGICATDLEIIKGYMGFEGVLGHEFVGIVEESPREEWLGRRVVGEINLACGNCSLCEEGKGNHCSRRRVLGILGKDGAFSEYLTLPLKNLHRVPLSVEDDEALFTEPLAAAFEITRQVAIEREERVALLGDGRLGSLVAQVLALTGCRLVVYGKHEEKLSLLKKRGIETALSGEKPGRVFDKVVECTGASEGLEKAGELVKPGGMIILKTTAAERRSIDLNRLVVDEVTLVGSRCGPFKRALEALERGEVDVCPLISRTFPLCRGEEALRFAAQKGVLKVILDMEK